MPSADVLWVDPSTNVLVSPVVWLMTPSTCSYSCSAAISLLAAKGLLTCVVVHAPVQTGSLDYSI